MSRRYRSNLPVRRADRAFDCRKRLVSVDSRVCGLMYVPCYCTAWENRMFWWRLVGEGSCYLADWMF